MQGSFGIPFKRSNTPKFLHKSDEKVLNSDDSVELSFKNKPYLMIYDRKLNQPSIIKLITTYS